MKTMPTDTLFVFYTLLKGESWIYDRMPSGWKWTGSGSTSPLGGKKLEYEREEQFDGTKERKAKMRAYLDKYFSKLKQKGIVSKYKIRSSYLP